MTRFGLGWGIAIAAGFAAFRGGMFRPDGLAFHCVSVGALTAAVLALLRAGRPVAAAAVTAAYSLLRLGFAPAQGWHGVAAAIAIALGVLLCAVVFDLLARRGILFGKFLVLGPLLGGVYVAVLPLAEFDGMLELGLASALMRYAFTGVFVGDTVGLGVEIADLLEVARNRQAGAPPV